VSAWTPQKVEIFKEQYFEFRHHVHINSKDLGGGAVLGEHTFLSQRMLLDAIFEALAEDKHDIKVLKSRQLGVSTETRALSLFWLGVHDGLQGAMVYDSDPNKLAARRDLVYVINSLPAKLKFPRIAGDNRDGLVLSNNSTVSFKAAGTRANRSGGGLGRSIGLNFSHCSEMCSWENTEGVVSFQQALSEVFENRLYIWESPLALDTPLLTPLGWTTIGAVEVGDMVFDEMGLATEVVGLSPIFYGHRCFEITFDTGEKIISDAAHKWQVERRKPLSSHKPWSTNVVTTEQLDPYRDRIWLGEPTEGIEHVLPINPYFLGTWLGDGHNEAIRITCGDQDMTEMRENLKKRGVNCGPITKFKGRGGGVFGIRGLMPVFNAMNLIGNKHIPEIYLRSRVEDRIELLRGMMDTDGSIVPSGHCTFTNSCRPLVNNFLELLSSLGVRYHVNWVHPGNKKFPNGKSYECRPYAMIGFMAPEGMGIFSLKRKLARQTTDAKRAPRRNRVARISSIREVPSVPVKCISVDTPTHLFRVGRTLIPTHNTARGPGLWSDMWDDAVKDVSNQKAVFLGWWSKDTQRFDKNSRAFHQYGLAAPTPDEQKRIDAVQKLYGVAVTQEQLAWYRRKMDPAGESEDEVRGSREDDDFKNAEQPWTEHEAFIAAGATFFPADRITEIRGKDASNKYKSFRYYPGTSFVTCQVQPARNWRETQLKVWEEPADDATYVISVDPAFGHDETNDRSAIQIMRCYADCIEQVAEFADPLTPTNHLAWIVWSLVGWYGSGQSGGATNPVHTIFELNGPGDAVWLEFKAVPGIARNGYLRIEAKEKGLENIFNNVRNYVYTRSDSMGIGAAYHFKTTGPTKISIMERLRGYTIDGTLIVHSQDTLDEMRNVTRQGDVIKAEGRKKDDRVITLALACRAWDDRARKPLISQNRTKKADQAKRSASIKDQYQLFSGNMLQDFLNTKKRARLRQVAEIRRRSWRGG
jgi:hypothetical protein